MNQAECRHQAAIQRRTKLPPLETTGPPFSPEERGSIAIHEAAHAVTTHHFGGRKVDHVAIGDLHAEKDVFSMNDEQHGRTRRTHKFPRDIANRGNVTDQDLEEEFIISCAGGRAEEIHGVIKRRGDDPGFATDIAMMERALFLLYGVRNWDDALPFLEPLKHKTDRLLKQLWPQVEAVADRLLEKGRLSGDELDAVIAGVKRNNENVTS